VEATGHEKMQSANVSQIDAAHLKYKRSKESDQIDDQQIFRNGWYAEHHKIYDLLIFELLFVIYELAFLPCGMLSAAKLRKISRFRP
jgi:hypothetical protein